MTTMFAVGRNDLRRTHWRETPANPLAPGAARLRIDLFALTSNNVTYGAFGDSMRYWDFFPTGEAETGCIPVWGFATVSESLVSGVDVGERFYGYWPMADEVVLAPVRVIAAGFFDGAPHRRELPEVYNRYLRCSSDPMYRSEHESLLALLQPLFITSFLIDDFLADNGFFGAKTVLVSSASSKTAYGLGFCLALRRGEPGMPKVVGLTSAANLDFTRGLGCYDDVVAYADLTTLLTGDRALYVDMSGDAALRSAVHRHWGEQLAYSCSVGGTHWQALGGAKGLPGPRPVLFFAPAQTAKRIAEWGAIELQQRLGSAWRNFIERVADPRAPWLHVVSASGREAVEETYAALLDGRLAAAQGRVLAL
ncbi:MAG: DUF2855 family protein [Pseudomonadota bacterium]|nr:DUF2855 family protein [Pseudomonadota bacterium]